MAVVLDPFYGPKPSLTLLGGSNAAIATGSVPFMPTGGRSITLLAGSLRTISFVELYRTQPWVAVGCRRMAEFIARLPLHLLRYLDDAGDTRERDRVHAAAGLLSRPRPRQRGFHLRWDVALSCYVHGNYVGFKRRPSRGAPPSELWTLDWRSLVPLGEGNRVLGWRWLGAGVPGLEYGDVVLVEDTVHVAFGAPGGGEVGISPLEQLQVTLRSEDALQRYSEAAMRNGTRFGMAAILDPKVKADKVVRDGVREELIDAHGGVDQAFRPAVLGGGITDLKPLGTQTAVEAELIQQRQVNREEAAAVIGIPQPLAGILDDANYSSLKELHRILYVTALGGPLELLVESLQAQLLDSEPAWEPDDRFLEWQMDVVLKGDAKERWETYAIGLDHGGLTLNDVRRKENLKPYEDKRADEPLIAANNVRPLSAIGQADPSKITVQTDGVAAALLRITAGHAARAFERAARGAGAGSLPAEALDRARVERELGEDLEAAGLNGSSSAIAELVAGELEQLLDGAQTIDDVRGAAAEYAFTRDPGDQ